MDPTKLFHYRNYFATLCQYACNDAIGRLETDPIYQEVVEYRDGPSPAMQAKYSSCADLAHWAYYRAGIRAKFINRKEHLGWVVGANLNRWVGRPIGPNSYSRKPGSAHDLSLLDAFASGDVIVIDNVYGGHVMCVTGYEPGTRTIYTAEYGKPGGKIGKHVVEIQRQGRNGLQLRSGNPIIALTRLEDVLDGEAHAGRLAGADVDVLTSWQAKGALDVFRRELVVGDADPTSIVRGED